MLTLPYEDADDSNARGARVIQSQTINRLGAVALLVLAGALSAGDRVLADPGRTGLAPYLTRPITDDVIYFVMPDRFHNARTANDRGGIAGDKRTHGFDPTDKAFYHGGDIAGITAKLDYLQDLGITAIWMSPIFKNKPVQHDALGVSAGYHGYWITDFTQIDPHLGTNDDLKDLVQAAHARDIKVIFDIITNHTADVIRYRECYTRTEPADAGQVLWIPGDCAYRAKADYPYTTLGGIDGPPINPGFLGDGPAVQTADNFALLVDPRYAYTPFVPAAEAGVKVPAWLNDPIYYHNRGDTTFTGEDSLYGDFFSLDDLFTEHPRVVDGMIDIYRSWITDFRIDGFRIDTVRHVNTAFWTRFVPAIRTHAAGEGIPEFFVFGEVFDPDPRALSHFTRNAAFPAVLDFGFQDAAARTIAHGGPTDTLRDFFDRDDYYITARTDASILPTFLGNHDMGRLGHFVQTADPDADPDIHLKRAILAHALMFYARGVPVIYYGDEQGFTGDGHDQDARENMFPSQVASYNDNRLLGTDATTADANFDTGHPLYRAIRTMSAVRRAHPALRHGRHTHRLSGDGPGLYAFSRIDAATGAEYLVALNTSLTPQRASLDVSAADGAWRVVDGTGRDGHSDAGRLDIALPALGYTVLRASAAIPARPAGAVSFATVRDGAAWNTAGFIEATVEADGPVTIAFEARRDNGPFAPIGRDRTRPYRVFVDPAQYAPDTQLTVRATATGPDGSTTTATVRLRIATPPAGP